MYMNHEHASYHNQIVSNPDVLGGKPTIRGTRIAVEHVLEQLADRPDMAELFQVFPDLTLDDVRACLAYAQALTAGEAVSPTPGRHGRGRTAVQPPA